MVGDKAYYLERNNSIHKLKFLNYSLVNLRQSTGEYLHNVRIVDSTLKRVDNTTRKNFVLGIIVINVRINTTLMFMLYTLTMGSTNCGSDTSR